MKKLRLNATLLLCAAILAACSGGSTEIVDYSKPPDIRWCPQLVDI